MLKIAFDDIYIYPLDKDHRFPMVKYELIPQQLIREGTCTQSNFFSPEKINDNYVLLTHEENYYKRFSNLMLTEKEERPIGFPMSRSLVEREKIIASGTIKCCEFSIKNKVSMNIAGGTHHAFSDRGEAFCMLNDQAIAANYLIHKNLCSKILIVDLDVHQGNGTASIFKDNSSVFTLSFHGKNNYPFRKEESDFDLSLDDGTSDKYYLKKLKEILPKIIDEFEPDFIFYLSGVDILENDKLGKLSMSIDGSLRRDKFIFELCKKNNIPVQVSMGGGYSQNLKNIIEAHANTFRIAQEVFF